jgi:hypothetical protein
MQEQLVYLPYSGCPPSTGPAAACSCVALGCAATEWGAPKLHLARQYCLLALRTSAKALVLAAAEVHPDVSEMSTRTSRDAGGVTFAPTSVCLTSVSH